MRGDINLDLIKSIIKGLLKKWSAFAIIWTLLAIPKNPRLSESLLNERFIDKILYVNFSLDYSIIAIVNYIFLGIFMILSFLIMIYLILEITINEEIE